MSVHLDAGKPPPAAFLFIPLIENAKECSMKDPGKYSQALVTEGVIIWQIVQPSVGLSLLHPMPFVIT